MNWREHGEDCKRKEIEKDHQEQMDHPDWDEAAKEWYPDEPKNHVGDADKKGYIFTILGHPIPKKRPRLGRYVTYDPQVNDKIKMKLLLKSQMNAQGYSIISQSPVEVKMSFYTQIPKSASKRKQMDLENVFNAQANHGDCDNFFKFYSDCMNEIVYDDDKQIVKMSCEKRYSSNPRVEITVIVLEEPSPKEILIPFKTKSGKTIKIKAIQT